MERRRPMERIPQPMIAARGNGKAAFDARQAERRAHEEDVRRRPMERIPQPMIAARGNGKAAFEARQAERKSRDQEIRRESGQQGRQILFEGAPNLEKVDPHMSRDIWISTDTFILEYSMQHHLWFHSGTALQIITPAVHGSQATP